MAAASSSSMGGIRSSGGSSKSSGGSAGKSSIASFLFNGKPPPSTTKYGSTTTNMPKWYSDYSKGVLAKANAIVAEPYQAYGGPRIAGFNKDQINSFDMARSAATAGDSTLKQAVTGAQGVQGNALATSRPLVNAATAINGQTAAAGALGRASQDAPGAVGRYMNPYTGAVVDRIGDLGARNLREKLMPAIGDDFTRAGQFGSSRMQEVTGRALRDTQESVLAQQNEALQSGYGQAMQAFQNDANRFVDIGQTQGQLAGQQQQTLLNAGNQLGNFSDADSRLGLDKSGVLSSLAGRQMEQGTRGAALLEGIGQTQQGQNQRNLDLAYSDFQEQRDYPKTQLGFLSNALKGFELPSSTTTTSTAPDTSVGASPLAQAASSYIGLQGLLSGRG